VYNSYEDAVEPSDGDEEAKEEELAEVDAENLEVAEEEVEAENIESTAKIL